MDIILKTTFTDKDIARFWGKASRQDCWEWQAGQSPDGYGKFSVKRGKKALTFRAHRLSFYFSNGYILKEKLICHTCDNPLCINPKHLFEGSVRDNARDMIAKGRANSAHGEQLSTLTEAQVISIRERVAKGEKQISIARELGLGKNQIWYIVNRKTWKHL